MIFIRMEYPSDRLEQYRSGDLFPRWKRRYATSTLFLEINPASKQFPFKNPVSKPYGFGELFVGIYYLRRGYNVTRHYFSENDYKSSRKAIVGILGKKPAQLICRDEGTQPPDLFIHDSRNRFLLVEVKLPSDSLSKKQLKFYLEIERCLNENAPQWRRARCIPKDHWIQVIYLVKGDPTKTGGN